jgi:hypothetical protein
MLSNLRDRDFPTLHPKKEKEYTFSRFVIVGDVWVLECPCQICLELITH